jgi:hypothetical protein
MGIDVEEVLRFFGMDNFSSFSTEGGRARSRYGGFRADFAEDTYTTRASTRKGNSLLTYMPCTRVGGTCLGAPLTPSFPSPPFISLYLPARMCMYVCVCVCLSLCVCVCVCVCVCARAGWPPPSLSLSLSLSLPLSLPLSPSPSWRPDTQTKTHARVGIHTRTHEGERGFETYQTIHLHTEPLSNPLSSCTCVGSLGMCRCVRT